MSPGLVRRVRCHRQGVTGAVRLRRSPHLVCYWQADDRLVVHNYAGGVRVIANAAAIDVLTFCGIWRSPRVIRQRFSGYPRKSIDRLLADLIRRGLLHRSDRQPAAAERAAAAWRDWNPAAGFFHLSTKDMPY